MMQNETTETEKSNAVSGRDEPVVMPFSGHSAEHLYATLKSITESGMPVEIFDAFLSEYTKTGDLNKARFFAMCEWDC
jgi:hypothetical protein